MFLISLKNPQQVSMMSAMLLLRHPKNMPITAAWGLSVDLANRHQYRFHNFNIAVGSMIDVAEIVVAQSHRCKEEWKLPDSSGTGEDDLTEHHAEWE